MRLLVVVQARTGSSRLPGKVLLPLAGRTVLEQQIDRIRCARTPFDLIVATTTGPGDDAIEGVCRQVDVACFRGHPTDLLDRHYQAAVRSGAEAVVKIPSDCPAIDPAVIDRVLGFFLSGGFDFVSNLHPASWPDGMDVEAMTFEALRAAHADARRPYEREHTTPFLWDQPDRFRIGNVSWAQGRDLSMSYRLTLDYPEDYSVLRAVFDGLAGAGRPFTVEEAVQFLDENPDVRQTNALFAGVNWYRHHLSELATVRAHETCEPREAS